MDDDSRTTSKKTLSKQAPRKPRPKAPAKKKENKNSFVGSFKNEWAMFWEGLTGSTAEIRDHQDDEFARMKLAPMSMKQIKEITRSLSQEKMKLNQRLESIHRELELNSAKLNSLKLVGGSSEEVLSRINELTDQGQKLASELELLDQRLKIVRKSQATDKIAAV